MRKPNYNKFPATEVQGTITIGWDKICNTLSAAAEGRHIIALELYTGTYEEEIIAAFGQITDREIICTRDLMKPEEDIIRMTAGLMTDDTLFGHVTYLNINDYFDAEKLEQTRAMIAASARHLLSSTREVISTTGESATATRIRSWARLNTGSTPTLPAHLR